MTALLKLTGKAMELCDGIISPKEAGKSPEKEDEAKQKALEEYSVKCALF